MLCGVRAVIVGGCMFLCVLTGSRATRTSLFFFVIYICTCI